jgi:hypothetical protein
MLTPTTELEAINSMLSAIGESPVSTVEDTGVVDAVMAKQTLDSVSRQVQSRGWHFNTEPGVELIPTFPAKELLVPSTTLKVDPEDTTHNLVQRGRKLYDLKNRTYKFDNPVTVTMIVLLPFDELIEQARAYIATRASRLFQENVVGSELLDTFYYRNEVQVKAGLEDVEAENADYNVFNNPSIARVLYR